MKKSFAIFIGLICLHTSYAQSTSALPETSIKAAYMGSIIYPGFKIGIERPSNVIQVEKTRSWGTKTILKERYWTYNLGFYHHETFHSNVYLLVEKQMRRQYGGGFFMEFAPGLGYSHTFLDGATYQVTDNGTISKKSLAGYNYAMLSIAGGVGYDFSKKTDHDIKLYLKPSLLLLAPYNSFVYARPTLDVLVAKPFDGSDDIHAELDKYSSVVEDYMAEITPPAKSSLIGQIIKHKVAGTSALTNNYVGGSLKDVDAQAFAIPISENLYKIKVPTLLLFGKHDFVCPTGLSDDIKAKIW